MDAENEMTGRNRFLAAINCQPFDRTPVWLMRQAGRSLPEYRDLKRKHSFLQMVRTPELAVEVTLQPIHRFQYDAAILFSDILVIPEAMGQPYAFRNPGGISMEFPLRSQSDIDRLNDREIPEKLAYVAETLKLLRRELADKSALIGFSGSPWTLATYMAEGGSSANFQHLKQLFHRDKRAFESLMLKISDAVRAYLDMQVDCGVDALQIFDSWGGNLAGQDYEDGSLKWIRRSIESVADRVPVILFAKGCGQHLHRLAQSGARTLSLDWTLNIGESARAIPSHLSVQGNLDPLVLNLTPEITKRETERILTAMKDRPGHIFNLGHGLDKHSKLENIEMLLHTIRNFR